MNKTIILLSLIFVILMGFIVFTIKEIIPNSKSLKSDESTIKPSAIESNDLQFTNSNSIPGDSIIENLLPSDLNMKEAQNDYAGLDVSISDFLFIPQIIRAKTGTTVTWINDDPAPHQIMSTVFSSNILNTGDSFSFTFTLPGIYNYRCSLHPAMSGQVIIE